MSRQPNRLPADTRHGFGGGEIDRDKPLRFRLNGRSYEAFAGDTVLTALLAAGVDTAGQHQGSPIGLDECFAPLVAPRGARQPTAVMAMNRMPVVEGLDLLTRGPALGGIAGLAAPVTNLFRRGRSLGHRLDEHRAYEGPWLHAEAAETIEADTVVIGGGVAGMSAALAAADAGGRVLLVERRSTFGGDARFFGTVGDEEAPEATIARLAAQVAATPAITVFTHTEAFNLAGTRVRVHEVRVREGRLEGRVVRLAGKRVILATGAAERLPVFAGNRMPGVIGAIAAFQRAERYGIWAGRRVIFATPHNFAYRLALLAADAGIEVQRVVDSRPAPQSRFVDFAKASGITLASGLAVRSAEPTAGHDLNVGFSVTIEGATGETAPMATSLLVAAGTWQPRLSLWLMAGGASRYDLERRGLVPEGTLEGVQLAGAAAGFRGTRACLASGGQSGAGSDREASAPVEDIAVDAVYETPPGITPIAPWRAGHGAAFLDNGPSFAVRPPQPQKDAPVIAPSHLQPLGVGDVAAAVEIGIIPVADAGVVAGERCLGAGDIGDSGWRPTAPSGVAPELPPYLHGRFGPKPQTIVLAAGDGRSFEPGCLIYPNSDAADPLAAIGVIVGPAPAGATGARAIVSRAALPEAGPLFVRDTSGPVHASIIEKLKAASPAKSA